MGKWSGAREQNATFVGIPDEKVLKENRIRVVKRTSLFYVCWQKIGVNVLIKFKMLDKGS